MDLLVEGDRILDARPEIVSDKGAAETYDATGKWLIPGLIDVHVHVSVLGMEALPVFVGTGVTTIRDLGGDLARLKQLRLDVERRKVVGPEILYCGPTLHEHPARSIDERRGDGPGAKPLKSAGEVAEAVGRLIEDEGVHCIKFHSSVSDAMAAEIIRAVDGRVPVTGHLGRASSKFVMHSGIDGIEHLALSPIRDLAPAHRRFEPGDWNLTPGFMLGILRAWAEVDLAGPEVEQWLRIFLDSKCCLTPTITTSGRPPRNDARLGLVPRTLEARLGGGGDPAHDVGAWVTEDRRDRIRENQRGLLRLIYENGGKLAIGSDLIPGLLPGWSMHAEMAAFERRGVPPLEVLRLATSGAATWLRRDDIGRIAAGMKADIVIVDANPGESVGNLERISRVFARGVGHDPNDLLAIAEPNVSAFYPPEKATATGPEWKI